MKEIGSIGRIARQTIKEYLEIRSNNKRISDKEIFKEIINKTYKGFFSNKEKRDDLLRQSQISIGLAGFIFDICIVECSLTKGRGWDLDNVIRPIWTELEKLKLDNIIKYGPDEEDGGFGEPNFLNDKDGYVDNWAKYIYDESNEFHNWEKNKY
ncbi:hypothetical protein OAS95_04745 [Pelagibacteraceae bacterium]|nr:hypothetical protein [Pelagibacteraceae bacterium]